MGRLLLFVEVIEEQISKTWFCIFWRCLHLIFSTKIVSNKWKVHGFKRRVSYEQYPEEKYRFWLSSFKKKLISLYKRLLDVTISIYPKSCAYHPDNECWHSSVGICKNPKCSDDTPLTFIRINNTQIVLVCAYKKMMHSTATRCVVFICHIGEGLRWFCKPYSNSSFFSFFHFRGEVTRR